ncbi:hypothetical protein B5U98_22775 [Bosea sp. Tri-39]|nr:hypothetical protein B5U98_22775 [Bosea sp. Tri-39]RXT32699.1 hypothetical protein B5U99_29120 [Bosea sp. Tri-54]
MARADLRSKQSEAWRPWYGTARWQRRRAAQLMLQPLCERCLAQGLTVPATVANHRIAHKGDAILFWEGELESVCAPHHDSVIQAEEKRGFVFGNGEDGRPRDPRHPWNR